MNKILQIPDLAKQIYKKDILSILEEKYSTVGPLWSSTQLEWCNGIYEAFNNHDKYLINIYLKSKTLDFYSKNFIKLNHDEFYSKDIIEIGKFNVMEISRELNIPKESARRKIDELEKEFIIKKKNKKIYIDSSGFSKYKSINTIIKLSRFLAVFSNILVKNKILPKLLKSDDIEKILNDNFSYVWKIYYEMQLPMLLTWKDTFKDLETWHIWGICAVNDQHNNRTIDNDEKTMNRKQFIEEISSFKSKKNMGINAMSISDISGIPRATVIRKLNKLVKNNYLIIDEKKRYRLKATHLKKVMFIHKRGIDSLAHFSALVYNLIIVNEDKIKIFKTKL